MKRFNKSFTQQEAIPEFGIDSALKVLRSGRLHRYNAAEGEHTEVELLEEEFAQYLGIPYCLACSSGGYALHIALRAAGVASGDKVLCNAFTLAPVPGAIHNSGAIPELIDIDKNYRIDLVDLEAKAQSSGARFLLLSHMRGHIADMDKIADICQRYQLFLIEDCAHTMGASWNGVKSGTFGDIACFSTQTYKHINSGEGGLLTSRHPEVMAKAIVYSGSYMLYERHLAAPGPEAFNRIRLETPNYSGRMDNLRAAILRPQLRDLEKQCERWNQRYKVLENVLQKCSSIHLPERPAQEQYVGSSIQFSLPGFSDNQIDSIIQQCQQRGVIIKWFGRAEPEGYTSRYDSWQYLTSMPELSQTESILSTLMDMRIPLTFGLDDCRLIGEIVGEVVTEAANTN